MSRPITPPITRIPIGTVVINGRSVEVQQHPEIARFFFDLFTRVGSSEALSNTELEALLTSLDDASSRIDSLAASIGELRNSISSIQGGETIMQSPQIDQSFPDVMQSGGFDVYSGEMTWQR